MLLLWKHHMGTVVFEAGMHAWLARQSGAVAIALYVPFLVPTLLLIRAIFSLRRSSNVGTMLAHCLRRLPNIYQIDWTSLICWVGQVYKGSLTKT